MTLSRLRKQIDQIDSKILRLLNRRATLVVGIGKIKKKQKLPVYDGHREEAVLRRLMQASPGPLPASATRKIFREILKNSRKLQSS